MPKLVKKYKNNFTQVNNQIFRDERLSYKDQGVLTQLLSFDDNWNFSAAGLASIKKDGRDSVKSSLCRLEELDYLVREMSRKEEGKYTGSDYFIFDDPEECRKFKQEREENSAEPLTDFPLTVKPTTDNPHNKEPINNIEKNINKNLVTGQNQELNNLIHDLEEKYELDGMYFTATQMADINKLVRKIGTNEIKSNKDSLLRYLHKIYDNGFKDSHGNPIKSLYGYVKVNFGLKTSADALVDYLSPNDGNNYY